MQFFSWVTINHLHHVSAIATYYHKEERFPTDRTRMCALLLQSKTAGPLCGKHTSPYIQDPLKYVGPENMYHEPFTYFCLLSCKRESFKSSLSILMVNLVEVIGAFQACRTTSNDFTRCACGNHRRSRRGWTKSF